MAQGKQATSIISNPFPWYITQRDHIIAGVNITEKYMWTFYDVSDIFRGAC